MGTGHDAAVIGVGHSRVFRHAEVPLGVLAIEAARRAIADAGLAVAEIDGVASVPEIPFDVEEKLRDGRQYVSSTLIRKGLGIAPDWGVDNPIMIGNALIDAIYAVEAGACSYAVVVRALHSPMGAYGHTTNTTAPGIAAYRDPYGLFAPAGIAQIWHNYQDKYGTGTREQMATFIVQGRENGLLNPNSYWHQYKPEPLTVHDYLTARPVSSPFTVYDCDIPIQGAAAFVVTTARRAKERGAAAAYVRGVANPAAGIEPGALFTLEEDELAGRHIGELLWEDSGLKPSDIDVANLYDGFSMTTMQWLEALGFAPQGQAFEFIQDGRIARDGELPLNTGGGNLGCGRMHGVPHLMDSILQVMGRAGDAQVADAAVSLAAVGLPTFAAAAIFSREP